MARHFPRFAYNRISLVGAALAVLATTLILILLGINFFVGHDNNPYLGIFLYMVVPPILVLGLVLIPLGMWRQWRRWKKTGEVEVPHWPVLDFGYGPTRNAALVFLFGTVIFAVVSAIGTYGAYHYSESVAFCGTTCHQVMEPEYVTYQNSPHARVPCTECHVGSGASWYVKSKMSGLYQVYSVMANKYPRPIPTPVHNLRPAQQTCEQCHWPSHFYGAQLRQFPHYRYDETSSPWPVDLLLKIGGGDPAGGLAGAPASAQPGGIHWHMNIGVKVEYIARDERRQDIPWVRVTDPRTGRVTVYQDSEKPLGADEIARATPRRMDCVDCHNRPSHTYRSPDEVIDKALLTGRMPNLPYAKQIAVKAMAEVYADRVAAREGIASTIVDFYRKEHPDVAKAQEAAIQRAVAATQDAYSHNVFPEMKARWDAYPINIGHFRSPGCMRCHDGKHTSSDGVSVTRACNACHIIQAQGSGDRYQMASTSEGLAFDHPEDIGDMWQETGCWECHTGVQP